MAEHHHKHEPHAEAPIEDIVPPAEGLDEPGAAIPETQKEEAREEANSVNTSSEDGEKQQQTLPSDMADVKRTQTTDSVYPPAPQVALIIVSLLLALFLMALDRTIISTAIPKITDEFHSLDDIGWYGSAFLLTSCLFQLLFGRVYTFYTPKYVFIILITIFEIGSAICGAAPNSIAFIFGRAIAGVGAAGLMSGAIVLMMSAVPLHKRPMFQGFFGAVFGVASVVGPLLGGVFTTDVSWRWCFYINLPIGAVVLVVITFILKPTPATQAGLPIRAQLAQLDLLGELFLFPCIVCLLLALQWGGTTYAWSNGRIIALFTLFAALFVAFIIVQIFMQKSATIQKRIIVNRNIIGGMIYTFCMASEMMISIYYLPIWFQAIKGVSAVESGIRTIPLVLSLVFGSILAGQVIQRIGYYTPFLYLSCVIMPIGAGLLTTLDINTSEAKWIGYQILVGFGVGVGMQQANMAAQTVLPKRDVPMGISVVFFAQLLAGAIFISVGQNILDSNLVKGLAALPSTSGLTPAKIVSTGATDLRGVVKPQYIGEVLVAYNAALRQVFVVGAAMASLAILGAVLIEWKSVKAKDAAGLKDRAEDDVSPGGVQRPGDEEQGQVAGSDETEHSETDRTEVGNDDVGDIEKARRVSGEKV